MSEQITAQKKSPSEILAYAAKRSLAGGLPGAMAMGVQVTSLMWLRTIMNYQGYRHGMSMKQAATKLYAEGGILRFYRGYVPALAQGPLSRFGDTAANAGALALLEDVDVNVGVKTACASVSAGLFRILLMPVDAVKTSLQVEGKHGLTHLKTKIASNGPRVLFNGSLAASGATIVGHFPWFFTFNTLNEKIPKADTFLGNLGRTAFMGFCSSVVSDTVSNSIRVIKTTKQTHQQHITYPEAVKEIVAKDGVIGLFGRGLQTRILTNGLQGLMFAVVWKYLEKTYFGGK